LFFCGCSHVALSGSDLDQVNRPVFLSRIEEGAGPESRVFRDDATYAAKLKTLAPEEADRRLRLKLVKAVSRFALSDRLRADTLAFLPQERPWTQVVDAAQVATALDSFLVEEVPAHEPNYALLKPFGADSVVEFVVEHYGMRSEGGKAGAYVNGFARMFRIDSGQEIWRQSFTKDAVEAGMSNLDPFWVGKNPSLFRNQIDLLLDDAARGFAKELSPQDRRRDALKPGAGELETAPDDTHAPAAQTPAAPRPPPPPPDDELPPPDGAAP
jgi:hypothetical protein